MSTEIIQFSYILVEESGKGETYRRTPEQNYVHFYLNTMSFTLERWLCGWETDSKFSRKGRGKENCQNILTKVRKCTSSYGIGIFDRAKKLNFLSINTQHTYDRKYKVPQQFVQMYNSECRTLYRNGCQKFIQGHLDKYLMNS